MNAIRRLRREAGITQGVLAEKAGSSQPTIAAYESDTKSPTLRTVERLAASVGLELVLQFAPRMSREDRRSLAYHREVAEALRKHPEQTLDRARAHLDRLKSLHPHASALLERWSQWLSLPVDDLIARMLDPGSFEREMRQVSPFAGVLDARERARVLKEFRREYRE